VNIVRILFIRASKPENGPTADEAWLTLLSGSLIESGSDRLHVMTIDRLNEPAVRLKSLSHILGEAHLGLTRERDLVVIPEVDEVIKLKVTRHRRGFSGDSFHEVAIAHQREYSVIENILSIPSREHLTRERESYAVRGALSKRPGGALYPGGDAELRMPRGDAIPLTKALKLTHREVVPEEVQHRVKYHAPVTSREYETIAIDPRWVLRVKAKIVRPQHGGKVGGSEWESWVSAIRFLYRVNRKRADGIRELLKVSEIK
jgi:hypothetical protein